MGTQNVQNETVKKVEGVIADRERFEALSRVVGQVAHDFNNLLTPLLAYPPLIDSELPEGSSAHGLLKVMVHAAEDMAHIAKQLLVLSARGGRDTKSFRMDTVLSDVMEKLRCDSIPEGIAVTVEKDNDLPLLTGSMDEVEQAILNLCRNGIEAMEEGGALTLRAARVSVKQEQTMCGSTMPSGQYVRVTVADTGSGIPEELATRVFEPFVTTRRSTIKRGSGLGLSIVYRVAGSHDGHVDFESVPGRGTTFHFYLPIGPRGNGN